MKISEVFYSLQGEGSLVGVPSVFIRTTFCNLRCVWCDTPYTSWRPEGVDRTVDDLVGETLATRTRHVVITGGEPMIAPEIGELARRLHEQGLHITIETAGTVFQELPCDLMSISPKLGHSTPHGTIFAAQHERLRLQPEVLRRLMARYEYQLKFVLAGEGDVAELQGIVRDTQADPARVVLMPEGTRVEILRERSLWLAEVCKRDGYRFSPRLHVDLWGDRRGV